MSARMGLEKADNGRQTTLATTRPAILSFLVAGQATSTILSLNINWLATVQQCLCGGLRNGGQLDGGRKSYAARSDDIFCELVDAYNVQFERIQP